MAKILRIALVLMPTAAFVVTAAIYLSPRWNERPPGPPPNENGRIVVVMVFDQLRGDYPQRWKTLFDSSGFARIERDGVWYANAHLPYSCSATGPGHASIGTGLPPREHGIIENEWYDRKRGGLVLSVTPDRPSLRVPIRSDGLTFGFAPDQLLADGFGDHLKQERPDSRVFSLALKDRAAVLLGGKRPDGAYAFDTDVGEFHTASRYRDSPHSWVTEFNKRGHADKWFSRQWERLKSEEFYTSSVGADDAPGETRYLQDNAGGRVGYGSTFPHLMNIEGEQRKEPSKRYYERLEASPFGNELLAELAWECVVSEQLGSSERTDLLLLGFSANDTVGHKWGPDSHETLDCTLRADRIIAETIAALSERFGPNRWTLIVTSDHGICPLPERWLKERPEAERFDPRTELSAEVMGQVLDEKFGRVGDNPAMWFADGGRTHYPHIYLNHAAVERHGVKVGDVASALAKWAANRPHLETAFTREQLLGKPSSDPVTRRCQLGYHPDRGGDVYVVPKEYCLPTGEFSLGTSHGTPHRYDTHVPLCMIGGGVPKLGRRDEEVSSLLLGPILCQVLGIHPPEKLPEKLPVGW